MKGQTAFVHVRRELRYTHGIVYSVDLVRSHELRLGRNRRIEEKQLTLDRIEILYGIATRRARDVYQMNQDLGTFDVPQEPIAEAVAFVRTLDQSWHVRHNEAAITA